MVSWDPVRCLGRGKRIEKITLLPVVARSYCAPLFAEASPSAAGPAATTVMSATNN